MSEKSSRQKFLETVKPVAIGGQIVGSNHFDEYNIKIDDQGKAIITSIQEQSPRDAKDIIDLFMKD